MKKEDIIETSWSDPEKDYVYRIKEPYMASTTEWVKTEKLWLKEELG